MTSLQQSNPASEEILSQEQENSSGNKIFLKPKITFSGKMFFNQIVFKTTYNFTKKNLCAEHLQ